MCLNIPTTDSLPSELLDNPLPIDEVLYEAEAPIIYLTHTKHGQTMLAYLADETKEGSITFLSPISKKRCTLLKEGCLSVREAITASSLWFHLFKSNGEQQFWVIDPSDIPNDYLPMEGTPLLPEHESVFKTRAIGEHIALGKMPASVVGFVADATRTAFKTLLDFTSSISSDGRPRDNHRKLYDLPIQRFAFASFELGFSAPDEGLFPSDELKQAVQKLEDGLVWAACSENNDTLPTEADERVAILKASLELTPPNSGDISEIEISGTWIKHGRIKLTRQSRKKVRAELHKLNKEKVVTYCGRIGEIDDDKLSFTLRDVTLNDNVAEQEYKGFFEESLLDDMKLFYYEETRVAIAGVELRGRLNVTAVAPESLDAN